MRLPARKWWFVFGGIAILALVAVIALPLLIDVNRYRGLIQDKAEEALGREVRLGELSLSLMPFGVRVDSLSIGALPEEGGGEFLTARSLEVGARLLPLLSKRLEVTSINVVAPEVSLIRGAEGHWNVQRLLPAVETGGPTTESAGAESTTADFLVSSLRLSDGRIHLRDAGPGRPVAVEMTLERIDLRVTNLALDRPIDFELSAGIGSDPTTTLRLKGQAGPLAPPPGESLNVSATIELSDVDAGRLEPWFQGTALPQGLRIEQPFDLAAEFQTAMEADAGIASRGTLEISGAGVSFARPDGSRQSVPVDLGLRYDIEIRNAGADLKLNEFELDLSGNKLAIRGTAAREGTSQRVDLELLPSEVPADDLAMLMALIAIDLPVTFSSTAPVEFEGGIKGLVGEGETPDVEAELRLRDFTLNHPSLDHSIEQVGATVSLSGERIEVTGLEGIVGTSDIAGRVSLEGFGSPHVSFDLHSRNADFGELFSFLDTDEQPATKGGAGATGARTADDDPLAEMTLEGKIRIDRGTFQNLDFSRLEASMSYARQVLKLDPLTMQLYDGEFSGRIESDLSGEQPTFAIRGDTSDVDLGAFIGDNLEMQNVIAGRFSGKVETRGAGVDYASIIKSLEGAGSIEVTEGQLGKLNVMERLSGVSGLFGATTLERVTEQLATEGTAFEVLSGEMRLAGGSMRLDNLLFDAASFELAGEGVVDLLTNELDGDFQLSFSPELSALMRSEHSQAARVFWNSSSSRIELPLTLSGPFSAPMPGIDFEAVAENLVKEEVRGYLSKRLGLTEDRGEEAQASSAERSGEPSGVADRSHPELAIRFERPNWRGNFLARDCELTGSVSGKRIDRASLTVVDSEGRRFENLERLPEVDAQSAATADRAAQTTIRWRVLLDGKKLRVAEYPLHVTVTVFNGAGESAQSTLEVDR